MRRETVAIIICKVPQGNRCFGVYQKMVYWLWDFYRMAACRFSQEQPQKTLSVEIRLHRDCDSRWVADSALEVLMESLTNILQKTSAVVYKAHTFGRKATIGCVASDCKSVPTW